jgi:hypothetical protein
MGEHWYGPVNEAIQCNSWTDFVKYFGGFNPNLTPVLANPYLAFAVYFFFACGGTTAWIARVGNSITPGSTAYTTFQDNSATPQNTLTLTLGQLGVAGNPGSWGNSVYADIVTSATPGRFAINIYKGAYAAANLVESWADMSMNTNDPRYVLTVINSQFSGSLYVVATNLGDTATPPANAPKAVSGQQFAGGADSIDPSTTDRVNAITQGTCAFDYVPGPLNFNLPGETTPLVTTAAINYSEAKADSFCVIDPPFGLTPAAAVAYGQALTPIISNASVFYPCPIASDPSSSNLQATRVLPPGGFILGEMVRMDNLNGPWNAPAGLSIPLSGVVQMERKISPSDQSTLNLANVNVIRQRANGQIVIWGTRTLEPGYASLYIPVRRTLNYIEAYLTSALESVVFQPNDQQTWTNVLAICNQFLGDLLSAGAFPTTSAASAYYVVCDTTNNTPQTIAQGIMNVTVGVALKIPAEFIQLTIAQFQGANAGSSAATPAAA